VSSELPFVIADPPCGARLANRNDISLFQQRGGVQSGRMSERQSESKTLIGVLASHDSARKNIELSTVLTEMYRRDRERLGQFHFLFTQGTFNRCVLGRDSGQFEDLEQLTGLEPPVRDFVAERSTVLPRNRDGGVILLSYFIVRKRCSILWTFLTPTTTHWLNPELLALMRLSDVWRAKRLMNYGSVEEWFLREADRDVRRRLEALPPSIRFSDDTLIEARPTPGNLETRFHFPRAYHPVDPDNFGDVTIALIAHDSMKPRMVEFTVDFEFELARFKRILTTGTTGREILGATTMLKDRIQPYNSGPKGGDIEIATEILYDRCEVVIFFVDPLHPHPHTDDIRVVFGAAMRRASVRMLANEMQAREWMGRVVREH
jgi:methylglyoxal synthase